MRSKVEKITFSQKNIAALKPAKGRVQVYSDSIPGLGLRIEGTRKLYFWWRKVRGKACFKSIGLAESTPCAVAVKQATEWNGELERAVRNNFEQGDPFVRKAQLTLRQLIARYTNDHVRKTAHHPEQAVQANTYFEKALAPLLDRKLGQISRAEVRELHARLSKNGPVWADRTVQFLKRVFNWALHADIELFAGENPAEHVRLNGYEKRDRFLTPEELLRLDAALENETHRDLKDFVELALASGLRYSNVVGMAWSWVNETDWTVNVPAAEFKNGTALTLPLTPKAFAVLRRRQDTKPSGWVFPSATSSTGHLQEIKAPWKALLVRAEITNFTPHDLRRTNASYQSISGQSLQAIARTLGHQNVNSTQVYARLNNEAVRESLLAGVAAMNEAKKAAKKMLKAG